MQKILQRYAIATLVGCTWIAWPSWPYMAFFAVAPVVVALITSGYASKSITIDLLYDSRFD